MATNSNQPRIRDEGVGRNRGRQATLTANRQRRSHSADVSRPQYKASPTKKYIPPTPSLSFDMQVSPLFKNLRIPDSEPEYHDVDERRVLQSRSLSPNRFKATSTNEIDVGRGNTYLPNRKQSTNKMQKRIDTLLMFGDDLETNSIISGLSGEQLMTHCNNMTKENEKIRDNRYLKKNRRKKRENGVATISGDRSKYVYQETRGTATEAAKSCSTGPLQIRNQLHKNLQIPRRRNRSIMKKFLNSRDSDLAQKQDPNKPTEEVSNLAAKRWTKVKQRRRRIEDFSFLCGKITYYNDNEIPECDSQKKSDSFIKKSTGEEDEATDRVGDLTLETIDLTPDKTLHHNTSKLTKASSNDFFENGILFADVTSHTDEKMSNSNVNEKGVKEGPSKSLDSNTRSKRAIYDYTKKITQKLDTPLNREISVKIKARSDDEFENKFFTDFTTTGNDGSQEIDTSPNSVIDLNVSLNRDEITDQRADFSFGDSLPPLAKTEQVEILFPSAENHPKSILRNRPRHICDYGTYPLRRTEKKLNSENTTVERKIRTRFSNDVEEKTFINDAMISSETEYEKPNIIPQTVPLKDEESNEFLYEELNDTELSFTDDVGDEKGSDLLGSASIGSITSDKNDQKSNLESENELRKEFPILSQHIQPGMKPRNLRVPVKQFDPRTPGVKSALSLGKSGSYSETDKRSHFLYEEASPPQNENERYDTKALPASSSFSDGSYWTNDDDYEITDNEFNMVASNLDKTFERIAKEDVIAVSHRARTAKSISNEKWSYEDDDDQNANIRNENKTEQKIKTSTYHSHDEDIIIYDEQLAHNSFIEMVAAVVIQTLVRRFLAISKFQRLIMRQREPATISQDIMRGSKISREETNIRKTVDRSIESELTQEVQYQQELIKRDRRAATDIQRVFRGWWVRDTLEVDNFCAVIIQSAVRGYLAKLEFYFDMYRIILVQSVARMRLAQHGNKRRFARVGEKQQLCQISRNLDLAKYVASVKIQAFWRCYMVQERFLNTLADILIVQSLARRWIVNAVMIPKLTTPARDIIESYRKSRVVQHFYENKKKLATISSG